MALETERAETLNRLPRPTALVKKPAIELSLSRTSTWPGWELPALSTYGAAQQFVSVGLLGTGSMHWCQVGEVAVTSRPFFCAYCRPMSAQAASHVPAETSTLC